MRLNLFLAFGLALSCNAQTKPIGQLHDEQRFRDYTVRIYRTGEGFDGSGCFEILKAGKQVFFQKGFEFGVGNVLEDYSDYTNTLVTMGNSINSDGQPNLVISEFTGGAHCCFNYYIFQIGEKFRCVDQIETLDGESDFKDLRGDGNLELVMYDWTFAYFGSAGFAESAPEVILSYQDRTYLPDLNLMSKPAPTEREIETWAGGFKAQFRDAVKFEEDQKWTAPPEMWEKMLDLIYSGNMGSAWRLCDLSWPADHPGKELFLNEFKQRLKSSPYYKYVSRTGPWSSYWSRDQN